MYYLNHSTLTTDLQCIIRIPYTYTLRRRRLRACAHLKESQAQFDAFEKFERNIFY